MALWAWGQYSEYVSAARIEGGHYSTYPHNGFLRLVAELGVPAAIATFVWLAGLLRGSASRRKEGGAPRPSIFLGRLYRPCVGAVYIRLFCVGL